MPFDPNQPFELSGQGFDPNKPFTVEHAKSNPIVDFGARVLGGAGGVVADTMKGMGRLTYQLNTESAKHPATAWMAPRDMPASPADDPFYKAGSYVESILPHGDPARDNTLPSQAAGVVGTVGGQVASAVAGGLPALLLAGAGSGSETAAREAASRGATVPQQQAAAGIGAPVGAALNAVPLGRIAGRFGSEAATRIIPAVAASAAENAAASGTGQFLNNAAAKGIYDPNRGLGQGVADAAAMGAVAGGAVRGAVEIPSSVRALASKLFAAKGHNVPPEAVTPEMADHVVADPKVRAIMEANGHLDPTDPAYAPFVARVEQRVQSEQAKAQAPDIMAQANREMSPPADIKTVAADGTPMPQAEPGLQPETAQRLESLGQAPNLPATARADVEGVLAGDIHPGAARVPEAAPLPETIPVDAAGRADLGSPGMRAGADLRSDPRANLPVPMEQPRAGFDARMTPRDFAQSEARMGGGNRNAAPPVDALRAPEGRAPQTRADVQGQREAGQAFQLADRQRERIEGPPTRDTQGAAPTEGPTAQRVLLDDGHPVQVLHQDAGGVATVRRYDPRTGSPVEGSVEYTTPRARLEERGYTAEPRMAQDFAARDNPARMSPEAPRTAEQPVSREQTQTFRATPEDPNQQFPAAGEGRSPLPEQPPGPMPGADQPRAERAQRAANEEELKARYEQARGDRQYQDFNSRARDSYKGQEFKTSPVADAPGTDGRFATDQFGYLKSDKGGPIRFGDQKQAAKWILNVGHKTSPDQVFEVANHPKGGFTAYERGRSETKAEAPPMAAGDKPEVMESGPPDNPAVPESAATSAREATTPAMERQEPRAGEVNEPRSAEMNEAPASAAEASRNLEEKSSQQSPPDISTSRTAPDRPTGEEATPGGDKPQVSGSGTKLYSSPLDPEALHEAFGKPIKAALDKELKAAAKDKAWLDKALDGTNKNPRDVLRVLDRVRREAAMSVAGGLRSYASKYKNVPEIGQLADALATDPGSGRAVAEPMEYASNREAQRYFTRADNILENWTANSAQIRQAMTGGRVTAADAVHVQRLRKLLDEYHGYLTKAGLDVGKVEKFFPRQPDSWKVEKDTEGFIAAATKVYRAEGNEKPAEAAKAWAEELLTGGDLHVTRTPGATLSTRSTRERVFKTKAADQFLAPFMQDAKTTLADYFSRTAKQAEFARRFGAKGEKMDEAFEAMSAKGVKPDDISSIRNLVDNAAGLIPGTKPNAVSATAGWVHAIYTARLLGRSLTAQISEPFVAAVRTGNVGTGLKALGAYLQPLTEGGRMDRAEWRQRAELMGILGDLHTNAMLMNRSGATEGATKGQRVFLTRFFKSMGVAPITEFQMNTATKLADWRLRSLLDDVGGKNVAPSMRALADEFGIDEAGAKRLRAWADNFGGKPPPVSELMGSSAHGQDYGKAISRWVNETIQNPTRADKPAAASDPRFRAVYGITSFLFTYTRKVTLKAMKDVSHSITAEDYTPAQRLAGAAGPSIAFGLLTAINYGIWYARQAALNPQVLDELSDKQRAYSALSNSQVFGNFQPLIDMGLSVSGRFGRDLTGAYAGPQYTQAAADITNMVKALPGSPGNSVNTNNAEWQGSRSAYNAFVVNTALYASMMVPTGPLGRVGIFAADQLLAAPGTSRAVADAVAGERTVRPHKPPE